MEVNDTNTDTILRNMRSEGDSRAQYMQMMAAQLAAANERIAALEAALREIIEETPPNPKLAYGHCVNEIARAALAGVEPAGSE